MPSKTMLAQSRKVRKENKDKTCEIVMIFGVFFFAAFA